MTWRDQGCRVRGGLFEGDPQHGYSGPLGYIGVTLSLGNYSAF